MGIASIIKTRLLNNRVEQYNTKRSYWGEDERQPRTDGINTGLDLPDALPPVINKTIANARYAVKLDGYTSGILKNRIDKANVNMVLVDKENKLSQEQKLTLILWARKIDISQIAKNILQGGMVDGEGVIKPVQRWDKSIGKYIKPIFLEIGAHGYGLKKEFNDDNEVQLFLHEMPKDIVNESPEEFDNYCQAMNSIAFWLIQNKKNYKKRDYYQILNLNGSCSDIEKKAKKLGEDKLVVMYTMALIKDNFSLDFLPNYVTLKNGEQIDKAEYVDMAIRTEAFIKANGRYPAIVYRMSKLPDYNDSTMQLFIKTFNYKGNTIDEALAIIANKKLYSKYFDSQKTDKKTINDASQGKGSNCVDWGQVYYRIAKSLGYDVQFVHVKCRVSGTGHIRLRLKHSKNTGGNWINRDPAAVADTTSGNVRVIWCEDGYLIAYDPSWIFSDLYSS